MRRAGSQVDPICVDDDDEDVTHSLYDDAIVIDDDEIEDSCSASDSEDDVIIISDERPVVDDDLRWGSPRRQPIPPRNASKRPRKQFVAYEPRTKPLRNTTHLQGHFITSEHCLMPGQVVELREDPGSLFGCSDLLQIKAIFEDLDTHTVYVQGILYRRAKTLNGMLPKKLNEVYKVLQHNIEDARPTETQSLHDVPVSQIIRTRCLRHTNAPFPELSYRTTEDISGRDRNFLRDNAQLTCRWKRVFTYKCAADLSTGYPQENSIERILEHECDTGFQLSDVKLRRAVPMVASDTSIIDLEAEDATRLDTELLVQILNNTHLSTAPADSQNTFADFFSGAGGVSIGARAAGFNVKYAVDHDPDACATFRRNFPDTEVFEEDINDNLVFRRQANAHVRCCHLSTVCKTISTAYTVRGANHDANEATLFCISDVLRKATPMVATLEQTFGALGPSKKQIFSAFVWQFTAMNYSVRWAVHDLSEFGVPQARKRLVMVASCPGHPVPAFPKPTHGPGLRPFVTIADAFRPLRPGMPNHTPSAMPPRDRVPYSPHQLGRGCITTSGGQNNWFYTGKRDFTEREFACLQTFPLDHVFAGTRTSIIRQVGNAVPPAFSKKLYQSIWKTFEEVDRQDAEWDAAAEQLEGGLQNPIQLDDDMGDGEPTANSPFFIDLV